MGHRTFVRTVVLTSALAGLGCGRESPDDIAVTRAALSVCEEDVPADRNVDGIPSYAQCDASANSAIYSNNGVDTSTEKLGPDWIRTQWSGGYQCTELAHRYLYFKWDIDWLPNGNAGQWCDEVPPDDSGMVQTDTPVHGDLMVLAPGSCGAAPSTGHVTVVDVVEASGRLTVVEQNGARRGRYEQSCAACFLHVIANTGEGGASGIGGAGGMGGMGGSAGGGGAASGGAGGMSGAGGNGIVAGSGGVGGLGGMGGAGGAGAVGGSAGAAGAGGTAGIGGAAGMAIGGAGGMMPIDPPVAGAAAGTAGMSAAAAGAEALPITDRAPAPEQCGVANAGQASLASRWSLLGVALACLLRVRRRSQASARR